MRFDFLSFTALFLGACANPGTEGPALPADSDGDGLTDAEESELGTDPTLADSDGDLFADGVEVQDATNPLYVFSHTYGGDYNVGYCAGGTLDATGPTASNGVYAVGDVAKNFTLQDQFGEDVSLYSFCGNNTMLVLSLVGCPLCSEMAGDLQSIESEYAAAGFQVVELLYDFQGEVTKAAAADWALEHGIGNVPVLRVPHDDLDAVNSIMMSYDADGMMPSIAHIGADMRVLSVDEGLLDPSTFLE